jgi:hypothetical protein
MAYDDGYFGSRVSPRGATISEAGGKRVIRGTKERDRRNTGIFAPGVLEDELARRQALDANGQRADRLSTLAGAGQQSLIEQILAASAAETQAASGGGVPSLDDVLAPYIQARQSANEAYQTARPVIHDAFNDMLHDLSGGQRDLTRQSRQESRGQARDVQASQNENRQQTASAQQDLATQAGGDVAGSLAQMLAGTGGAVSADIRQSAQGDRQLASRIDQVGRQETRATREDAGLSRANALGTAQNNLDSILNAIGLEEAQAKSEWETAKAASSSAEAAGTANADAAVGELQSTINQATAAAAQSALSATLAAGQPWQKALDLIRADAGNLARGMTEYGVPIDPRTIIRMIRQLGPASQSNADAQRRQGQEQQQAPEDILAQLGL